ncbi:unnamed protein product [Amoebophrya sp. A120]|nr:unnamed protein product [Amoebophrya sp. A120]|eukprot:GSA120T00022651001.1
MVLRRDHPAQHLLVVDDHHQDDHDEDLLQHVSSFHLEEELALAVTDLEDYFEATLLQQENNNRSHNLINIPENDDQLVPDHLPPDHLLLEAADEGKNAGGAEHVHDAGTLELDGKHEPGVISTSGFAGRTRTADERKNKKNAHLQEAKRRKPSAGAAPSRGVPPSSSIPLCQVQIEREEQSLCGQVMGNLLQDNCVLDENVKMYDAVCKKLVQEVQQLRQECGLLESKLEALTTYVSRVETDAKLQEDYIQHLEKNLVRTQLHNQEMLTVIRHAAFLHEDDAKAAAGTRSLSVDRADEDGKTQARERNSDRSSSSSSSDPTASGTMLTKRPAAGSMLREDGTSPRASKRSKSAVTSSGAGGGSSSSSANKMQVDVLLKNPARRTRGKMRSTTREDDRGAARTELCGSIEEETAASDTEESEVDLLFDKDFIVEENRVLRDYFFDDLEEEEERALHGAGDHDDHLLTSTATTTTSHLVTPSCRRISQTSKAGSSISDSRRSSPAGSFRTSPNGANKTTTGASGGASESTYHGTNKTRTPKNMHEFLEGQDDEAILSCSSEGISSGRIIIIPDSMHGAAASRGTGEPNRGPQGAQGDMMLNMMRLNKIPSPTSAGVEVDEVSGGLLSCLTEEEEICDIGAVATSVSPSPKSVSRLKKSTGGYSSPTSPNSVDGTQDSTLVGQRLFLASYSEAGAASSSASISEGRLLDHDPSKGVELDEALISSAGRNTRSSTSSSSPPSTATLSVAISATKSTSSTSCSSAASAFPAAGKTTKAVEETDVEDGVDVVTETETCHRNPRRSERLSQLLEGSPSLLKMSSSFRDEEVANLDGEEVEQADAGL